MPSTRSIPRAKRGLISKGVYCEWKAQYLVDVISGSGEQERIEFPGARIVTVSAVSVCRVDEIMRRSLEQSLQVDIYDDALYSDSDVHICPELTLVWMAACLPRRAT